MCRCGTDPAGADRYRDSSVCGLRPDRSRRVLHIRSGARRSGAVCGRLGAGSGGAGGSPRTVEGTQGENRPQQSSTIDKNHLLTVVLMITSEHFVTYLGVNLQFNVTEFVKVWMN